MIEKMKREQDTVEMFTEWHQMIANKLEILAVTGDVIKKYKGFVLQSLYSLTFKKYVVINKDKFKLR